MFSHLSRIFTWSSLFVIYLGQTSGIIRYIPSYGEPYGFSTVTQLDLEYLGNATTVQWGVSDRGQYCKLDNITAHRSRMHCTRAGAYEVTATTDDEVTTSHNIVLRKEPGCFRWYAVRLNMESETPNDGNTSDSSLLSYSHSFEIPNGFVSRIRVWVLDARKEDTSELSGEALEPSEGSKYLTEQFYTLGEQPVVTFPRNEHLYEGPGDIVYNHSVGGWEFTIHTHSVILPRLHVRGNRAAIDTCFTRQTNVVLPRNVVDIHGLEANTGEPMLRRFSMQSSTSKPIIFKDPSTGTQAIIWQGDKFYLTTTSFSYLTPLNVTLPSSGRDESDIMVRFIAFTPTNIAFLTEEGVYLFEKGTMNIIKLEGTDDLSLSWIKGRDRLLEGFIFEVENDMLVAWSEKEIWLISGATNVTVISTLNDTLLDYGYSLDLIRIDDVSFAPYFGSIGCVVTFRPGTLDQATRVLFYDYTKYSWTSSSEEISGLNIGSSKLVFIEGGSLSYALWSDDNIYFSYMGDPLQSRNLYPDGSTQFLGTGESIQQVISTSNSEVVILTTTNNVFYTKYATPNLLQLDPWEVAEKDTVLWLDELDNLNVVSLEGTVTKRVHYPLQQQVLAKLESRKSCKYLHLSHNVTRDVYTLDIRDTFTVWMQIVYKTESPNHIQVSYSGADYLEIEETTEYLYGHDVTSENKTVTFRTKVDFSSMDDYLAALDNATRVLSFEMRPEYVDISCKEPSHVVSYIYIGCMGYQLMFTRSDEERNDCEHFDTFTIPSGTYNLDNGDVGEVDQVITYDWETLGCPIRNYNTDQLIPRLTLNNIYSDVSRNDTVYFVMWEKYNQMGMQYLGNMRKAGCNHEAQTWQKMRDAANNTAVPKSKLWGPWNFESCYSADNTSSDDFDSGQPYEIHNNSGTIGVVFTQERNTIYILKVTIVDPNFSYCPLSTEFAIQIYGATELTEQVVPLLISVLVFLTTAFLIIVVSYFYFRFTVYREMMTKLQAATEVNKAAMQT